MSTRIPLDVEAYRVHVTFLTNLSKTLPRFVSLSYDSLCFSVRVDKHRLNRSPCPPRPRKRERGYVTYRASRRSSGPEKIAPREISATITVSWGGSCRYSSIAQEQYSPAMRLDFRHCRTKFFPSTTKRKKYVLGDWSSSPRRLTYFSMNVRGFVNFRRIPRSA